MQRQAVSIVCCLLSLSVAWPSEAQSWKGSGRMSGEVTDPDENPVVGATIRLLLNEEGPEPLTTNKKGKFTIIGLARGEWQITIEAEGFMVSKGNVSVSRSSGGPVPPVPIRLKWLPEPEAESVPTVDPDFSAREAIEEGNRLLTTGDYSAARAAYEAALPHVEPQSRNTVLRGIASTWHGDGNDEQAIAVLEQVVATDPEDAEATRMLIGLLVESDRDEEARRYMESLPEDAEIDAAAGLTLGIDLYNQGDLSAALEQFERVVDHHPDLPDGYYYRGLIFLNQGENDAATADFERLLELDAEHAKAAEARGFLDYLSSL